MAGGAKPDYVEGLRVVFVVRLDEVSGLAVAAWAFLEPPAPQRVFDSLMCLRLFGIVPPIRAASLVSVFPSDAALPCRSLFTEPRVGAIVFLTAGI
jgi:hypothetical protein